jgi:hypothetical protein
MLLSIFALITAIFAMYIYKKFKESENAYYELHLQNNNLINQNIALKNRINDLENYKKDVSKTVYLLDNDIKEIKSKINNDDYLNSINDNTIVMDKSIINNILNEMPEIINNYENNNYENNNYENNNCNSIEEFKNEAENQFIDINSLNYEKYKI